MEGGVKKSFSTLAYEPLAWRESAGPSLLVPVMGLEINLDWGRGRCWWRSSRQLAETTVLKCTAVTLAGCSQRSPGTLFGIVPPLEWEFLPLGDIKTVMRMSTRSIQEINFSLGNPKTEFVFWGRERDFPGLTSGERKLLIFSFKAPMG